MCIVTGILGLATGLGAGIAALSAGEALAIGGTAGILGSLVGGTISTIGGVQNALSAQQQANYQADLQEENARMARMNAIDIEMQGDQERNQLRLQALDQLAQGRTNYGAAGVVLGRGSALDYEMDVADVYDMNRRNLDYDIGSRAWEQQVAAVNADNQAALLRTQAASARNSVAPSLLGGVFNTIGNVAGATGGLLATGSTATQTSSTNQRSLFDRGIWGEISSPARKKVLNW